MKGPKQRWLAAILVSQLTVACGSVPQTHYYVLTSAEGAAVAADRAEEGASDERAHLLVGVKTFLVDPPYDQGLLVYRVGVEALEVGFYTYHRWASSLGSLAALAFANEANTAPGRVAFEPATIEERYQAILHGRIRALEEVDVPDGQVVRVTLELSLDDTTGETLWQRTVASESKIQAQDAGQVVEQLQADFLELVRQATREITAVLAASLAE